MSLILEALKKSEARRQLGEAPGLGTPFTVAQRRRSPLPLIVILILVAAGFGWWYVRTAPAPAAPAGSNTITAAPQGASKAAPPGSVAPDEAATRPTIAATTANAPHTAPTAGVVPSGAATQPDSAVPPQAATPPSTAMPAPATGVTTTPIANRPALPANANAALRARLAQAAAANANAQREGGADLPAVRNERRKPPLPDAVRAPTPVAGSAMSVNAVAVPARSPVAAAPTPQPIAMNAEVTPAATPAAAIAAPATAPKPATTAATAAPAPAAAAAPAPAAAAPPAPAAPAAPNLPLYYELPYEVRKDLPPLTLSMHVYAANPAQRFVMIDGERKAEGESVKDGLTVREIRPDGVVLEFRNQRFFYPRPGR